MKIYEVQHIETDVTDYQSRIIEVDSWEEYVSQFKYESNLPITTGSIPRNAEITQRLFQDKAIMIHFKHPLLNKIVCHLAEILSEDLPSGVLNEYTKEYLDKIKNGYIITDEALKETSKIDFEREYYCQWKEGV